MPNIALKVELLRHTLGPEEIVALGAKLCYSQSDLEELSKGISSRDQTKFIKKLVDMGHLSPIEHASFTFGIEGVSRSLLAQITRHRIASFSVQSQRYVAQATENGFDYITPPAIIALGEEAIKQYDEQMQTIAGWYTQWQSVLGKGESGNEDARFVLPNASATRMIVTMNARELHHFFELRCCNRAQWEIRVLAWEMLHLVYGVAPALFATSGPSCATGACSEGKMSCGKANEMRARFTALCAD